MLFDTYYWTHHFRLQIRGNNLVKNILESGKKKRQLRDGTNSKVNNHLKQSFQMTNYDPLISYEINLAGYDPVNYFLNEIESME